jgi:predicted nucleic acid-binding protein
LIPYVDTSLVIALITVEERSVRARNWLIAHGRPLITSEWTRTEVASALSIKQRRGELDEAGRAQAERAFERMAARGLEVVPVTTRDFRRAADHVRVPERKLRGADALHIAVASRLDATLHSLDDGQVEGALQLGVDAVVTVPKE